MEFWGVEVKPGESLKVKLELCRLIHISQAAIGDVKDVKEAKNIPLRVTIDKNSYVIGTLSAENRPQLMFDLVFEKEFELSHGWKNGSVYFMGYETNDPCSEIGSDDDSDDYELEDHENVLDASVKSKANDGSSDDEISSDDGFEEEDSEDEENVLDVSAKNKTNGKVEEIKADLKGVKIVAKKAAPVKPEPKKEAESDDGVKIEAKKAAPVKPEPKKEAESDDDSEDDSDDDGDELEEDDESDDGLDGPVEMDVSDDSEDHDDDDDDSEEETPKKSEQKKRPAPVAKGTPASAKKAKQVTPEKTGGKKFPGTPASGKQNGKPAASGNNNPKAQTPKSGGKFSGKSAGGQFSGNKSSGGQFSGKSNKSFGSQQKNFKGKHGKK